MVNIKIEQMEDEALEEFFEKIVDKARAIKEGTAKEPLYESEKAEDWPEMVSEWIDKFRCYLSTNCYSIVKIEGDI